MRLAPALLALLLSVALLPGCGDSGRARSHGDALLVWNGRLFDGTGSDPLPDGAVLIEDGHIVAAGPRSGIDVPGDAVRIDARGGTIMPGVIDAHVHVAINLIAGNDVLSDWLQSGVTTLQDNGVPDGDIARIQGLIASVAKRPPRVQFAGPMLTVAGGYPMARPYHNIARQVVDAGQARAAVDSLVDADHVSLVKVAVERGYDADYGDAGWPVLSPEELRAITDEAHARGKIVVAHVTGPDELRAAFEAGVDVAGHAPITPAPDEVLKEAADGGMIMTSTAHCWTEEKPEYSAIAAANAVRFQRLGGRLAIGTDFPFAPNSMPLVEFEWLSNAGMSSRDLLYSATHESAAAIGRSADLGTLEPGKIADLIVVRGDPVEDWHAMADVDLVMLQGVVVKDELAGEAQTGAE